MTASLQLEALQSLLREHGLGSTLRVSAGNEYPPAPTGFTELDVLLDGGFPRGRLTEVVGAASAGRTSLVFSLLAEATKRREVAAYIDVSDSLDPPSAQKAGVALDRLLWVRCGSAGEQGAVLSIQRNRLPGGRSMDDAPGPQVSEIAFPGKRGLRKKTPADIAWQAVNLVAAAGGFGVIILDLGGLPRRELREWQGRQWRRLKRAIENSPTALVILAGGRPAGTVSALALEMAREKTYWSGKADVSLLLDGIASRVRIRRQQRRRGQGQEAKRQASDVF